jgi:hypothetical protein
MTPRWIAGLLLIPLAYTATAVLAARSNQATARAAIVLTQREAVAPYRNDENSATRLRLLWQSPVLPAMSWFDRDKLRELGFDVNADPADERAQRRYRRMLPRAAFVALEYDGPAWQTYLAAVEETDLRVEPRPRSGTADLRQYATRLIAVDAASDAGTLARRYPDGRRYVITAAVVRIDVVPMAEGRPPYLAGMILNIDPNQIYVPRELAAALPFRTRDQDVGGPTPYQVTIGYGARWEPYLIAVTPGAVSQ